LLDVLNPGNRLDSGSLPLRLQKSLSRLGDLAQPCHGKTKVSSVSGGKWELREVPQGSVGFKAGREKEKDLGQEKDAFCCRQTMDSLGPRHNAHMTVRVTRGRLGVMGTEALFPYGKDQTPWLFFLATHLD